MKILFITTYYHRANFFRDMMESLTNIGHKVTVFNAVKYGEKIKEKYKDIIKDNRVIHKECFYHLDRYIYPIKQWKIYKALLNEIDINEFDIIHSHLLFNGGPVALKIKEEFNIPFNVSIRSTDENVFMKIPFFNKFSDIVLSNSSGVQFLSPAFKERFIENYVSNKIIEEIKNKSYVLPNGLEEFWLNNINRNKKFNEQNNIIEILFVGKIGKQKNPLTILKAMEKLINKGFNPNLTVIGQKVDEEVYNSLEKDENVEIIGYVTKEELIKYYRDSDIFVMPSIHETFGRVYAEAMTQGLPVIYTKGQGFDGIFKDGYVGYSVPSKDYNYIADSIIKILSNYEEISKNCIKECNKFNWKNIANDLDKFYSESLERSKI